MDRDKFLKWNVLTNILMALITVGPRPGLIGAWLSTYPILHVVGFITSVVIEKPVNAIVYGRKN